MEPIKILVEIIIQSDGTVEYKAIGGPGIIKGDIPKKEDIKIEKMKFFCARYKRKVNKKDANSCHGCTIQCRLKNSYAGEVIEV